MVVNALTQKNMVNTSSGASNELTVHIAFTTFDSDTNTTTESTAQENTETNVTEQLTTLQTSNDGKMCKNLQPLLICGICDDTIEHIKIENPKKISHITHFHEPDLSNHTFCSKCVNSTVSANLQINKLSLKCYEYKCSHMFSKADIKKCLDPKIELQFDDFSEILEVQQIAQKTPFFQICPHCKKYGCTVGKITKYYKCEKCLQFWCKDCKLKSHGTKNCWIFSKRCDDNDIVSAMTYVISIYAHFRCPECETIITKDGGCNHITCAKCGTHSCFECGKAYKIKLHEFNDVQFEKDCSCSTDSNDYLTNEQKEINNREIVIRECFKIKKKNCTRVGNVIRKTLKEHGYELPRGTYGTFKKYVKSSFSNFN